MKPLTHLRTHSGLQAFFPTISKNVQEVDPAHPVTVAVALPNAPSVDRPRLLSKRMARATRRQAH